MSVAIAILSCISADPALLVAGVPMDIGQDKLKWMRRGALGDVVDVLIDAGLVDGITGKKMPHESATLSWASSYWPTDDLIRMALNCGITETLIVPDVSEEDLVQLYAPKSTLKYGTLKDELIQPRKGKRI